MTKFFPSSTRLAIATAVITALLPLNALAQKAPPPPPPPPPVNHQKPLEHSNPTVTTNRIPGTGTHQILGEVWADNWFRLYVNGKLLAEDSVPITTERSFNAERFQFQTDTPVTLAIEFRDFMENGTGLEYIGTRRQQMGDGGAIAQFTDMATGRVLAATGTDWRCIVQQAAPLEASCERETSPMVGQGACGQKITDIPANWMAPEFNDKSWPNATVHSVRDVRPKDGYDQISWDRSAELIWGPDLKRDNVILCRATLGG